MIRLPNLVEDCVEQTNKDQGEYESQRRLLVSLCSQGKPAKLCLVIACHGDVEELDKQERIRTASDAC